MILTTMYYKMTDFILNVVDFMLINDGLCPDCDCGVGARRCIGCRLLGRVRDFCIQIMDLITSR